VVSGATTFHNESGASWTASGSSSFVTASQLINDGTINIAAGTTLTLPGTLSGTGQTNIGSGANLVLQDQITAGTTETITFQGSGTLTLSNAELDSSLNFIPVITGLDPTDTIDFQGAVTSAFWNGGILTLMNGTTAVAYLHLSGNYASATFTVTQVNGVSQIVDPPTAIDTITNGAALELNGPSADKVIFAGITGTLVLDQPTNFEGQIAGLSGAGDVLTLKGFDAAHTTADTAYDPQNDTTLLTITDAVDHHSVSLILDGNYASTTFNVTTHQNGSVDITSRPTSIATVSNGETLELNQTSSDRIAFQGGTGSLVLDQPTGFTGHISGFRGTAPDAAHSDTIDLAGIDHDYPGFSQTFDAPTGLLTITDGTLSASFNFDHFDATLNFASDHHGGTLITDPPPTPAEQQSPNAATGPSGDQFTFKATLGDPDGGRIDHNFQSMHPDFDLTHSAIDSGDTSTPSAWLRNSSADLRKDFSIDPGANDHRSGHDPILSHTMSGISHLNDYILPSH
jgi:hypothetical protein